MGFWDKLKGELIDIIQWTDSSSDTLVYRFERYGNEIKGGAKLVCREGQAAVFINEGKLADVFAPGTYTLDTKNMPILSTIFGWKYGFESPFKAEVYFVNTRNFTDQKWGTKNPIMLRDPEFGPVRIRAFGTFATKVTDPGKFVREIVGTDGDFKTDEISAQIRNIVVARFADVIGESKIPVLDLAANYDELAKFIQDRTKESFDNYGLTLTSLLVENVSLPPAVEEALDKRSSMGIIGNLGAYTQFQAANAMESAAKNPGGGAGDAMGLGAGFAMGNAMMGAMNRGIQGGGQTGPAAGGPPPIPGQAAPLYVAIGGQQQGPFEMGLVQMKIQSGEIRRDTLVWRQGMTGWIKASDVAELALLFSAAPPPLPPS
ncbi:MAG: SPFH domain-containing protein [Planctomycetes bacterium]|nr:SPFH domain-containing protein [Planctomycetota bacterium]